MKKLGLLLIAVLVLVGCEAEQEAYKASITRQLAEEHSVALTDINISFGQSCYYEGRAYSQDTIMYVKLADEPEVYEYFATDCTEDELSQFKVSLYSKDGELPKSIEESKD